MAWKPEYAAARRAKYNSDPSERERRKAQGRTADANREYMRQYYAANGDRFREYRRANAAIRNARRRDRYATDTAFREAHKASVIEWQRANPDKRLTQQLRRFGITAAEYQDLLNEQGGGCAICGREPGTTGVGRHHVDHCHQTGVVRGVLCSECNLGLGKFGDDPARLEVAALYLRSRNGDPSTDQ